MSDCIIFNQFWQRAVKGGPSGAVYISGFFEEAKREAIRLIFCVARAKVWWLSLSIDLLTLIPAWEPFQA